MFEDDDLDLDFNESVVGQAVGVTQANDRGVLREGLHNQNVSHLLNRFKQKPEPTSASSSIHPSAPQESLSTSNIPKRLLPFEKTEECEPKPVTSSLKLSPSSSLETDVRRKFPGPAGLMSQHPPNAGDKRHIALSQSYEPVL